MSCREIAALRLAMMRVLGTGTEAEKQHELAELGDAAEVPGPLRSLAEASNVQQILERFDTAVSELEHRVAITPRSADNLGYLRALMVLCRSVALNLERQASGMTAAYRNLEELHDLTHELFPGD